MRGSYCLVAPIAAVFAAAVYNNLFTVTTRVRETPSTNADGSITYNLLNLYAPSSEEEIVEIVKMAYRSGRKLRVLSSGHSWSEIAQTDDVMLSTANYTGLVRGADRDKMTVTVRAGTKLHELNAILDREGLAMITMPTITDQSIVGAISTGTHGAGITSRNMASLVSKFKFVSGTGEVMTASEYDQEPSLFHAMQVSIGMLGVITEVTIHVERSYRLEERRTYHTLDYCLDHWNEITYGPASKVWLDFHNDFCIHFTNRKTTNPIGSDTSCIRTMLTSWLFRFATYTGAIFPSLTPHFMWLVDVGFSANMTRTDASYNIFVDNMELPAHSGSEVIVEVDDGAAFVTAMRNLVRDRGFMLNWYQEIRFVAGDNAWLSPQYNRSGTCALSLNIYASREREDAYYSAVHDLGRRFNARVHWGKYFYWSARDVAQAYPNYKRFSELRKKLDPKNVFINKFLDGLFDFA